MNYFSMMKHFTAHSRIVSNVVTATVETVSREEGSDVETCVNCESIYRNAVVKVKQSKECSNNPFVWFKIRNAFKKDSQMLMKASIWN